MTNKKRRRLSLLPDVSTSTRKPERFPTLSSKEFLKNASLVPVSPTSVPLVMPKSKKNAPKYSPKRNTKEVLLSPHAYPLMISADISLLWLLKTESYKKAMFLKLTWEPISMDAWPWSDTPWLSKLTPTKKLKENQLMLSWPLITLLKLH